MEEKKRNSLEKLKIFNIHGHFQWFTIIITHQWELNLYK